MIYKPLSKTMRMRFNAPKSNMKITQITAQAWDVPMRFPYRSAQRVTTTARNVLVSVTLSDGSTGYGESAPATYVTGETQETVLAETQRLATQLRGLSVEDADVLLRTCKLPGARGALETALCDAQARAANVPLYRFLGGTENSPTERTTDLSLPILPPDEAKVRANQAAQNGFRALKIKVGSGSLPDDETRVRAIASAAPQVTLRLDGNQGFPPDEAVRLMEQLADLHTRIELLEQPTKAGDDDALFFVARRVSVPVFADEAVHDADDARRLLERGACRGVVLKMAKSGLRDTTEIARTVYEAGGTCLFGCMMETRIAVGAALHLSLALGPSIVPMLDLDGHLLVRDEELLTGGLTQIRDVLRVDKNAPGLGLTLQHPLPQ